MKNNPKIKTSRKKIILEHIKSNKNEFVEFLKNYNVIQLAIGVVVGNAAKELVTAVANDLIMPLIGVFTPSGSWKDIILDIYGVRFKFGELMASVLDFLIVAIVVFVVVQKVFRINIGAKK